MYNFSEIKTKIAILSQREADTDYISKIGVWVNLSHRLLSEIYDYWIDLQDVYNFSTVDGQESYHLPSRFDKPLRLYDITNNRKITIKTEEEYFDSNIANIADAVEGQPSYARIYGSLGSTVPISSSGSTVQVKSSSASDTGSIVVRIQGYVDSNLLIEDYENVTVSAVTPTTYVSGSKTFYKITHISKSANTTGYLTIANSTGTVLEYLAPNERVARQHKVLKLGLIPDDAYSMRLLFKKSITELVNDYDYPFTECDRYLILDGWGWSLKQDKEDQRAEMAWGKAAEALKVLLANQNSKFGPDYQNKIESVWLNAHRR
jgi:hypothetical protein